MRRRKVVRLFVFVILTLIVVGGSSTVAFYQGQLWRYDQGYSDGKAEAWDKITEFSESEQLLFEAWSIIEANYIDELPSEQERTWAAIQGIVDYLDDPYTEFASPEDRPKYRDEESLPVTVLGQVGVVYEYGLGPAEGVLVADFLEGFSAEKLGFEVGDLIVAAALNPGDWRDLRDLSLCERVVYLTGFPGTRIWFKVERPEESEHIVVEAELVPIEMEAPPVYGHLAAGGKVGYLRIYGFDTYQRYLDFRHYLGALLSQGAEVLILDLRDNIGGSHLITALVADELLPEGKIIDHWSFKEEGALKEGITVSERGRVPVENDLFVTGGLAPEIPLVVLVNEGTGSGAEALAGAIQDHGRGILVGETTFGKGSGWRFFELSDGSVLWIKSFYGRTPLGRNIDGVGITPDIVVPMPEEPNGTDPQLEKALECALALLEGGECR